MSIPQPRVRGSYTVHQRSLQVVHRLWNQNGKKDFRSRVDRSGALDALEEEDNYEAVVTTLYEMNWVRDSRLVLGSICITHVRNIQLV